MWGQTGVPPSLGCTGGSGVPHCSHSFASSTFILTPSASVLSFPSIAAFQGASSRAEMSAHPRDEMVAAIDAF